ncbi:polyketide synthase, partial [Fischerella thermalis CCMEE 5328]
MTAKKSLTAAEIQAWLLSNLAEVIKTETDQIDVEQPLDTYGLDSTQAMLLVTKAEKMLGFKVAPTLLWHYPTIASLSQRLAEESQELASDLEDTVAVKNVTPTLDLSAEAVLDQNIRPVSSSFVFTGEPKNVFITGGTGFLGAFLIHELLQQTNAD